MSLGAQQMVALARAVAVDAKVLVMDEPTSSLEPREVQTLFRLVRQLSARGSRWSTSVTGSTSSTSSATG